MCVVPKAKLWKRWISLVFHSFCAAEVHIRVSLLMVWFQLNWGQVVLEQCWCLHTDMHVWWMGPDRKKCPTCAPPVRIWFDLDALKVSSACYNTGQCSCVSVTDPQFCLFVRVCVCACKSIMKVTSVVGWPVMVRPLWWDPLKLQYDLGFEQPSFQAKSDP